MARAIWKGVLNIGNLELPVKLYPAVQDRSVHFRLLHAKDHAPVKQELISSDSGETVEYKEVRKAFPAGRGRLIVLEDAELEELSPKPSRAIEITTFVSPGAIDHRWYERSYYLGPDEHEAAYFAAVEALEKKKKEGVARWVMRDREYVGALRVENGYLMLNVLRYAGEVIASEDVEPPEGGPLDKKELQMAEQLLAALEDEFDPAQFRDQYRQRVMELVETKAKGGKVKVKAFRPRKTGDETLADALRASLAGVRERKAGHGR